MTNILLKFEGTLSGGEVFSHSLAVEALGSPPQANVAASARDAFEDAWGNSSSIFKSLFTTNVVYQHASAAEILNLSTGALFAASFAEFDTPKPTGTGSTGVYQVAKAISLVGGTRPNGTPLRGRFYLPTIAANGQAGGHVNTASIDSIVDFIADLFDGLEGRNVVPAVWSREIGAVQHLTAASVGNVLDTIRSRRNALVEAYTPVTWG